MKISLVRHGQPVFSLEGKVRAYEVPDIIAGYNASGIRGHAPQATRTEAMNCNIAVCSDLRRSIESARALGFKTIHKSDPLFREVELPHFRSGSLRLPIMYWGTLYRVISVCGFSRNGESLKMAQRRSEAAALQLIELAQTHHHVLLVGHGILNHFIAKSLRNRHWGGPKKSGRDYWDVNTFHSPL